MGVFILLLPFCGLLLNTNGAVAKRDYCAIDPKHLACNPPGPSCPSNKAIPLTKEDENLVVELHNKFRSAAATGQTVAYDGVVLPTAADMNALAWDSELAYLASLNARQCTMRHDVRSRKTDGSVGQNLFMKFGKNMKASNADVIKGSLNAWVSEVKNLNADEIDQFVNKGVAGKAIGHFTQVVWGDTTKVGCAISSFVNANMQNAYLLACNYARAGNVIKRKIWTTGDVCSQCAEEKTCSEDDNAGLCV